MDLIKERRKNTASAEYFLTVCKACMAESLGILCFQDLPSSPKLSSFFKLEYDVMLWMETTDGVLYADVKHKCVTYLFIYYIM